MSTSLKTRARHVQRKEFRPGELILRLIGTGLLWATAGLHLDLYLTGYRTIPTIGWLFLFQVIAGLGLGVQFGLFGFREVRTTAGIVAGIIEVAAFAVLAVYALLSSPGAVVPGLKVRMPSVSIGQACVGSAAVAVVALGLLGGALAGPSAPAASTASGAVVGTADISGTTVLTNAKGLTLYWFAPDTATKSVCNGTCAQYWPPVPGPVRAGAGVTGTFSTIRRDDGSIQATYDGHPLYTYVGDSGRGQAHGNNLDLNGGYWHEVVVSG
jgi:predicted lipoprotein with Yx(FWY)xxD motif